MPNVPAPIGTLTRRTIEGLAIQPLYEPSERTATPAKATRGWDIRTLVRGPDPASANADILQDLAGGAASVLIRLDPTGADGIAVGSAEDVARLLDGVLIDLAPIALDAGFLGAKVADWLAAAAKGAPAVPLALQGSIMGLAFSPDRSRMAQSEPLGSQFAHRPRLEGAGSCPFADSDAANRESSQECRVAMLASQAQP